MALLLFQDLLHLIPAAPELGTGMCDRPYPVMKQQVTDTFLSAYHPSGYNEAELWCLMSTSSAICQQNMLFCQWFQPAQSVLPECGGGTFSFCKKKKSHIGLKKETWIELLPELLKHEVGGWSHWVGLPGARGWAYSLLAVVSAWHVESKPCSTFWALAGRHSGQWSRDPLFPAPCPTRLT